MLEWIFIAQLVLGDVVLVEMRVATGSSEFCELIRDEFLTESNRTPPITALASPCTKEEWTWKEERT